MTNARVMVCFESLPRVNTPSMPDVTLKDLFYAIWSYVGLNIVGNREIIATIGRQYLHSVSYLIFNLFQTSLAKHILNVDPSTPLA